MARQKHERVRPIRGLAIAVANSLPDRYLRDIRIQEAVLMYQESGDADDLALICNLYDPMRYRHRWYASYGNLFDNDDDDGRSDPRRRYSDFDGQMWECFLKSLARYRKGYLLNPIYYKILRTSFANIIKYRQAGKRNPQVRCPVCDGLVAPLSTHLIQGHPELMVATLRDAGIDMSEITTCPICDDRPPIVLDGDEAKMKHFRSRHSSLLFSKFMALYPGHHTAITDPAPPITSLIRTDGSDDDGGFGIEDMDSGSILDVGTGGETQTRNIIGLMGDECLTECQRAIMETIIYDGEIRPPLADKLCEVCLESRGECPRDDGFTLDKKAYRAEMGYLRDLISYYIPSPS